VKILESPDGPSVVADVPKNLATPALGGAIVRFTSRQATWDASAEPSERWSAT